MEYPSKYIPKRMGKDPHPAAALFQPYALRDGLVQGPGHRRHQRSAQHPGDHALEVALRAVFAVHVHRHGPQPVELLRVELHLCFQHVSRLGHDGRQDAGRHAAGEMDGRRVWCVQEFFGDHLLGLCVEHEV